MVPCAGEAYTRSPTDPEVHMNRDAKLTIVARAVHETIRAYQQSGGSPLGGFRLDAGKHARIGGVRPDESHSRRTTRSLVHLETPRGLASWPDEGSGADDHPSLVPFGELPATEQLKDTLLIAIVQALARPLDL